MNDIPAPPSSTPTPAPSMADLVERVAASVVGLATRRRGAAAGVVWRPGVIVTAASALGHADRVTWVRANGDSAVATVRGIDPSTDLAVIEADTGDLPAADRRLQPPVRVGDAVFAVGRESSGTVHASFGRIGAAGGAWRTWRGGTVDALLRLDGGLFPGLAGAAVGDADGRIVGIASPALARHHGVVLPPATIDRISERLLAHGHVAQGYLGIAAQPVSLPEERRGLLVAGMADDGPAAKAGVLVGDVIIGAGGQALPDVETLRDLLAAQPAGARVRLQMSRGGQPLELGIEIAERPRGRCH